MCLGKTDGRIDRLERHLELQDEEAALCERLPRCLDVSRAELLVRARVDEDAVLSRGLDDDSRDAVRRPLSRLDKARVDMVLPEILE